MRVLVAEESDSMRGEIRDGLATEGFMVDVAANGEDGLWLAKQNVYDAVIFAVELPFTSGIDAVKALRGADSQAPILVIGASDAQAVDARAAGADDVLGPPFVFADLLRSLRTIIRQRPFKQQVIHVEDLVIDTVRRTVRRGDTEVHLSPREYTLLEFLAQKRGELVKRQDIWEHVYEFRDEVQSNVVDVYISYLRRKLGDPQLIHTKRGQGYVLGGLR
ncbi:MAG: response regulator transcription factor [Kofleriaceae bacterium]